MMDSSMEAAGECCMGKEQEIHASVWVEWTETKKWLLIRGNTQAELHNTSQGFLEQCLKA